MNTQTDFILYQTPDKKISIDVKIDEGTVWLNQTQISELFDRERTVISKHIANVFKDKELDAKSNVQNLHIANSDKPVSFYNLDVIISVGYRVKSLRGTQFRIWANSVLKNYLLKGYAINDNIKLEQYEDLKKAIKMLSNVLEYNNLKHDEAIGLLQVLTDYAYALDILDKYDHQQLLIHKTTLKTAFVATYETAMLVINELRKKFGGSTLFGREKDDSFRSSMATIYQTFDSQDLYPSVEEKAAMLLYLVVKNHSFSDGNKRIAAFLFLWFLSKNEILYRKNSTKLIENNTLVALTLMIAESKADEKDMMIKVTVNLINQEN